MTSSWSDSLAFSGCCQLLSCTYPYEESELMGEGQQAGEMRVDNELVDNGLAIILVTTSSLDHTVSIS